MDVNIKNKGIDDVIEYLNEKIGTSIKSLSPVLKSQIQEIRLRVNKNISIVFKGEIYFLSKDGQISKNENNFYVSSQDIFDTINKICEYSIFTYQNQIKNGYVTLKGGHRVGICGTAVLDSSKVVNIRDVSSLNIRIATEIKGCSQKILEKIGHNPKGTLITGPPMSGKTTILRDMARKLSLYKKVSIVDERGEIGAVFNGIPQVDIGMCDVLNGYPKEIGIIHAIRALSPEIIICDEIGLASEVSAIEDVLKTGSQLIASIHLENPKNLMDRPQIRNLIKTKAFFNIIFLNNRNVIDNNFEFIDAREYM